MTQLEFSDSIHVALPPAELYELVSDVTRTGEWSPVCKECWWDEDATGPEVGAWFIGRNVQAEREWQTRSQVVAAEPGRTFAWEVNGGWVRRCPTDGSEHFPRTDPAVIMLVHDGGDRCVLGRQAVWPEGRFSILAGFVEPGEAAEAAVAREVDEEVGLPITDITYAGSQPWPFPSSLMLGFTARATGSTLHLRDGELAEARWLTRDEVRAGVVRLPPPVSIAHRIITDWLAQG